MLPDKDTTNKRNARLAGAYNAMQRSAFMRVAIKLWNRWSRFRLSLNYRRGILSTPEAFDSEWYLAQWPDVSQANIDPYLHYLIWGWKQGRNPSPGFDVELYLYDHPEVAAAGIEPFGHYLKTTQSESSNIQEVELTDPDEVSYSSKGLLSTNYTARSISTVKRTESWPNFTPRLCFHIPASPDHAFYSQIAMFRLALNALGDKYQQADIVVTVEADSSEQIPHRWSPFLAERVHFNWLDPKAYDQFGEYTKIDARWLYDYSDYDFVIFVDADVVLMERIDELFLLIQQKPGIYGTIAHYPPPFDQSQETAHEFWQRISNDVINKSIKFNYRHTLMNDLEDENALCPFYVNFGFVMMTPEAVRDFSSTYLDLRRKVISKLSYPRFSGQVSIALSVAQLNFPAYALPLRYNFPNDRRADSLQLNELQNVRIMHYLRTHHFNRQQIFSAEDSFKHFLSLELVGSDKLFQDFVRDLTAGVYPFG